jgi:hypothetical protein
MTPRGRRDYALLAVAAAAWGIGAALRLWSPGTIEFKGDEDWTFEVARWMTHHVPWVPVGMDSSTGLPNPGMSAWVFGVLAWVSRASTPIGLARAVACLNIVALAVLFAFGWTRRGYERGLWLSTAAFVAVDPLGVLFERKIWPPCTLPLLMLGFLWTWRHRARPVPAMVWGLLGAVVAQIHLSAAFYVAAFAGWALFTHLRAVRRETTAWVWWLGGSVAGSLLAIPWLIRLPAASLAHNDVPLPSAQWGNFWRMWLEDVVGWTYSYPLGPRDLHAFVESPVLGGRPTGLVHAALWVSLGATVLLVLLALRTLVAERDVLVARLRGDAAVAHDVAFVLYGLVITALPTVTYRHYLLVTYPLQALTLPLLASLAGRRAGLAQGVLAIAWAAHLVLAASLLGYLAAHHGAPTGDFGDAFDVQKWPP